MTAPSHVQSIRIRDEEGNEVIEVSRYGNDPQELQIDNIRDANQTKMAILSKAEARALAWSINVMIGSCPEDF